ncbi:lipopolysaccharide assembly protein LapA domain-containing protein [Mangrovitalea sediminis]|uniref:lipopolysaccharide assembly protein LapA domain-containing protein n=1 Tax=Mangrovitalea sediminis TaxID=1982043 RepID=UPI001D0CFB90|nr:LapA family protein [Mangrovitalea sediminis]
MLARLRKFLIGLVVILLIFFALVFSLNNQVQVSLNFLVFRTPAFGVAIWLISAFVLGGVLGVALTSLVAVRQSVARRQLARRLEKTERALDVQRSERTKVL